MSDKKTLDLYLKDLETLVNIDSGQDNPSGILAVADFFKEKYEELGWKTELRDIRAKGPLFIAVNREADHYDYLLTGHMDTVFPLGTAAQRPYKCEGNRITGPGVCDMKSGLLTALYAVRALDKSVLEKKNFLVVYQPDEEIGSMYSRKPIMEMAEKCDKCLVFEAAEDEDVPIHCIQRKGMIQFLINFTGKAGHAGFMLTNGSISAITEMAYWINSIMTLVNPQKETSANIGIVSGGTASNVVAEKASMKGEVRFECIEEADKAKKLIASLYEHAKEKGVEIDQPLDRFEPPMVPSTQSIEFAKKLDVLAKENGQSFCIRKRGGLSAANFISTKLPVCVDGMGPDGNKAHSVNEYLCLDAIEPNLDFAIKVITLL